MVDLILDGIVPYKPVRFLQVPKEPYAVYFDEVDHDGGDHLIAIEHHRVRIELYSEKIEPIIEANIETRLIEHDLVFTTSERTWINAEQIYMTNYYIEYTTKKRRSSS